MTSIYIVLFFSLIGGFLSLIGGLILFSSKLRLETIIRYATPFAAGALLGAAFFDLLPEAAHQGNIEQALMGSLIGILFFFVLEGALHWFHHHKQDSAKHVDDNVALIIIGDTMHNFVDGIAIATAFLVSVPLGIVATIAVAAHEIPQEIGDFGLLLKKGLKKRKVVLINILSSLATTIAALIFFALGSSRQLPLDLILGLVAGFFIYIAVSDIIPDIHRSTSQKRIQLQSFVLIVGVFLVGLTTTALHRYIEPATNNGHAHEVHEESHKEAHERHED